MTIIFLHTYLYFSIFLNELMRNIICHHKDIKTLQHVINSQTEQLGKIQ